MEDFLKQLIREAGGIAKDYFHKGVTFRSKSHIGDLVTVADEAVSDFLVKRIREQYSNHMVTSEEMKESINPGAEYEWVIDPIDGTRNFANGVPMWCVMIAVLKDGEQFMASVFNPLADELFFAKKDHGATMNGLPIRVNEVNSLDHSFGVICRGATSDYKEKYAHAVSRISLETNIWMHNFGTMYGGLYVATGGADFFINDAGFAHDYLAPLLIMSEAGAVVTNVDGEPWTRDRRDVVVANPTLYPTVMKLFT